MIFVLLFLMLIPSFGLHTMEQEPAINQQALSPYTVEEINRLLKAYIANPNHEDTSPLASYIQKIVAQQRSFNRILRVNDDNQTMLTKMSRQQDLLIQQLLAFEKLHHEQQMPSEVLAKLAINSLQEQLEELSSFFCIKTLIGHQGPVTALALTKDNKILYSGSAEGTAGSSEGTLKMWNTQNGQTKSATFDTHITSIQLSNNQTRLAVGFDNEAAILDPLNLHPTILFPHLAGDVWNVIFNADDTQLIVSQGTSRLVSLFDLNTHQLIKEIELPAEVTSISLSNNKNQLVCALEDSIQIIDLTTEKIIKTFNDPTPNSEYFMKFTLTPDKLTLISANQALHIWDLATGKLNKVLQEGGEIRCLTAPTNGMVIAGSQDHTIKVWDILEGTLLHTLHGHTGPVRSVVSTNNGRVIMSGSEDNTIKIWQKIFNVDQNSLILNGKYKDILFTSLLYISQNY